MRGVILEGVTGAGKTRLFGHLQRVLAARRPSNTKLFLSEHVTERALEHLRDKGELTLGRAVEHLGQLVGALELLQDGKAASKLRGRGGNATVIVVVERFLLGQLAHLRIADRDACALDGALVDAIAELYPRAHACELATVILRVAPEAMRERVLSTRQHRKRGLARLPRQPGRRRRDRRAPRTVAEHAARLRPRPRLCRAAGVRRRGRWMG